MKFNKIKNKEGKNETILWVSEDNRWVIRYHYPEESVTGKLHTTLGPMTTNMTSAEMYATARKFYTKEEALRYVKKLIANLNKILKITKNK